jgi:hypothetical protein
MVVLSRSSVGLLLLLGAVEVVSSVPVALRPVLDRLALLWGKCHLMLQCACGMASMLAGRGRAHAADDRMRRRRPTILLHV